jgi:hypothetical protein
VVNIAMASGYEPITRKDNGEMKKKKKKQASECDPDKYNFQVFA